MISGITHYGLYVELPNTVEGLVHVNSLEDDYYEYDEDAYELKGEHSGKSYRLGERIKIYVKSTDRLCKTVDFALTMSSAEEDK